MSSINFTMLGLLYILDIYIHIIFTFVCSVKSTDNAAEAVQLVKLALKCWWCHALYLLHK